MPSSPRHLAVGITGGIGCGKSTVAGLFARLGRTVLSADTIARELADNNAAVRSEIVSLLGEEAYLANGPLDRSKVAGMIFKSSSLRRKLEQIIHPAVFQEVERRIAALPERSKRPYVLLEAALIFETGYDARLDYTIVVDAPEETRISRVIARDRCTREEVLARIASQMPAAMKVSEADFVIVNDQNETALPQKVEFVDMLLQRLPPVSEKD